MSDFTTPGKITISHPTQRVLGRLALPGSKSESNRLLVLKQLYFPDMEIEGLSDSADTLKMQQCLADRGNFIHAGDAGTVMRFLTASLAIRGNEEFVLQGSARMHQRPIGDLVEALQQLGSEIEYLEKQGFPPLKIFGKKLSGGQLSVESGVSSQFVSALMMIGPGLSEGLKIQLKGFSVSTPYIYLTAGLMHRLGFKLRITGEWIEIDATIPEPQKSIAVEADWSSASYWFLASLLAKEAEVYLPGLREYSLQGDSFIRNLFAPLGVASLYIGSGYKLKKASPQGKAQHINLIQNPDLAQTMAVAYAATGKKLRISGLQSLRIKETDRLEALKRELGKTGAELEIGDDYLEIHRGVKQVSGVTFETYEDHRMAMALAPLALLGTIHILHPEVVVKSYPRFWHDMQAAGFEIHEAI